MTHPTGSRPWAENAVPRWAADLGPVGCRNEAAKHDRYAQIERTPRALKSTAHFRGRSPCLRGAPACLQHAKQLRRWADLLEAGTAEIDETNVGHHRPPR